MSALLLVDSSKTVRTVLERGFQNIPALSSFHCHHAESGMDAIPILKKQVDISLCFISTALPDLDPSELLSSLHAQGLMENKQIIFITDNPQRIILPPKVTLLGYLIKPFNMNNLAEKISPLISSLNQKEIIDIGFEEELAQQKQMIYDVLEKYFLDQSEILLNKEQKSSLKAEIDAYLCVDEILPETDILPSSKEILSDYLQLQGLAAEINATLLEKIYLTWKNNQQQEAASAVSSMTKEEVIALANSEKDEIPLNPDINEIVRKHCAIYYDVAQALALFLQPDQAIRYDGSHNEWIKNRIETNRHLIDSHYLLPVLPEIEHYLDNLSSTEGGSQHERDLHQLQIEQLNGFADWLKRYKDSLKQSSPELAPPIREVFATQAIQYGYLHGLVSEPPEWLQNSPEIIEKLTTKLEAFISKYGPALHEAFKEITQEQQPDWITAEILRHLCNQQAKQLVNQCKHSKACKLRIMDNLGQKDLEFPSILDAYFQDGHEKDRAKFGLLTQEVHSKFVRSVMYVSKSEESLAGAKSLIARINPLWKFYGFVQSELFERDYAKALPSLVLLDFHYTLSDRSEYWKKITKSLPEIKSYSKILLILEEGEKIKGGREILSISDGFINKPFPTKSNFSKLILA